jgi:hypothetical protein
MTRDQFLRALEAESDLMLVSARGPRATQHQPAIGDGNPENRVDPRDLGHASPDDIDGIWRPRLSLMDARKDEPDIV